jgi:hypothetical protein
MWLSRAGTQGCWCARWGTGKGISITLGKLIGFCSETFIKNINIVCLFHFQKTGTMVWSTIYDTDKVRGVELEVFILPSPVYPSQL